MNSLSYTTGPYTVKVDLKHETDIFTHMGPILEVLEHAKQCGLCGSTDIQFRHFSGSGNREGRDYTYEVYKAVCQKCTASLRFIPRKDGTGLFPSTRDRDGDAMPDDGWAIYKGSGERPTRPVKRHDDVDEASIPF
jgi:hypothetical protein